MISGPESIENVEVTIATKIVPTLSEGITNFLELYPNCQFLIVELVENTFQEY